MQKLQIKLKNTPRNASLVPCSVSSGLTRVERKIEKSHINDAFIIANGSEQKRNSGYLIEQRRKNNRCLQINRKGFKPSIRRKRSIIQPKDLVKIGKLEYKVKTMFNCGSYIRVVNKDGIIGNYKIGLVDWHYSCGGLITDGSATIQNLPSGRLFSRNIE